jgi:hypothetical protein
MNRVNANFFRFAGKRNKNWKVFKVFLSAEISQKRKRLLHILSRIHLLFVLFFWNWNKRKK